MGEDVRELMEMLGIEHAILVGHSMGGGIVGYLAATYQNKVKAAAILDKTARGPEKHIPILSSQVKYYDAFTKDWCETFDTRREALECIRISSGSELETEYFINSLYEDKSGYHFLFSKQALAAYRANNYDWMDLLSLITFIPLSDTATDEEVEDIIDVYAKLVPDSN